MCDAWPVCRSAEAGPSTIAPLTDRELPRLERASSLARHCRPLRRPVRPPSKHDGGQHSLGTTDSAFSATAGARHPANGSGRGGVSRIILQRTGEV
jgi:hypothetical protein